MIRYVALFSSLLVVVVNAATDCNSRMMFAPDDKRTVTLKNGTFQVDQDPPCDNFGGSLYNGTLAYMSNNPPPFVPAKHSRKNLNCDKTQVLEQSGDYAVVILGFLGFWDIVYRDDSAHVLCYKDWTATWAAGTFTYYPPS